MALLVWLPLNGNLNNQGLSNTTITNRNATIDDNGKIGLCYKFNPDNSSSGQNYLLLNSNLSDILPTNGKSFSFACWIKLTGDLYSNGCGLIAANQYKATGVGLYIKNNPKKIHIHMCYDGAEQEWTATNMTALQNNVWYHVTYTYNETGRQMTVYINGVNVDSTTANDVWATRNEKISIGRGSQGGWGYTLPGFMNDVRIYDHCLSPKEVKEISKGLVLHYKLDDPYLEPTTNLLYNKDLSFGQLSAVTSYSKQGEIYTVTIGNYVNNYTYALSRLYFPLEILENESLYALSFKYKIISGAGDILLDRCDWCDKSFSSKQLTRFLNYNLVELICPIISTYNSTYRFMDFHWTDINTVFEIYDVLLEKKDHVTPFTSNTRNETTVYDCSGYGNNGIVGNNSETYINSPRYNSCLNNRLTGTTYAVKSIFDFPQSSGLTIGCWIYLTTWGYQTSGLWTTSTNSTTTTSDYNTTTCAHRDAGFDMRGTNGTTYRLTCDASDISLNTWKHVVVTHNGSDAKLYIDGILKRSLAVPTPLVAFKSIYLGRGISRYSFGNWSDFRIYATALSDSDILELYNTVASVDNHYNLNCYEISEHTSSKELIPYPANIASVQINPDKSYTLTGHKSWWSDHIPVNPTGKTYYYDIEFSQEAGNWFLIGFGRFDENKQTGPNEECLYVTSTRTVADHKRITGTITFTTVSNNGNPVRYIRLRILNDWDNSGNQYKGTIHHMSLKEVSLLNNSNIEKTGEIYCDELIESDLASITKYGNVICNQLIEI